MRIWQLNFCIVALMVAMLGAAWVIAKPKQEGIWKQCKLLTKDVTVAEVCADFQ